MKKSLSFTVLSLLISASLCSMDFDDSNLSFCVKHNESLKEYLRKHQNQLLDQKITDARLQKKEKNTQNTEKSPNSFEELFESPTEQLIEIQTEQLQKKHKSDNK